MQYEREDELNHEGPYTLERRLDLTLQLREIGWISQTEVTSDLCL